MEEGDDGGELFDDGGVDLNGVQEFIFQLEAERREEREQLHRQLAEQYTELETLRAHLPPDRRELSRQPSALSAQVSSPTSPPHCLAQDPPHLDHECDRLRCKPSGGCWATRRRGWVVVRHCQWLR